MKPRISLRIGSALVAFAFCAGAAVASSGDDTRAEPAITSAIVNGVQTQSRPTTGALLSVFGPSSFAQSCSGTLIGCQTFLTAAHCVCPGDTFCTPTPSDHVVFLQHVGVVGVSAVNVHPDYSFGVESDIAVLTLTTPVVGVSPSPINTTMTPPYGTDAVIAGFGLLGGGDGGSGILREGAVLTAVCGGGEPEPAHVCWAFENPVGAPGTDSNTCNGDSGGPLFVDFGGGEVVAGVTSGGSAEDCLPSDDSFDANVFQNAAFVQSVAGADLLNTACGAISQVGDPSTQVITLETRLFPKAANKCRKEIRKQVGKYTSAILKASRVCLDKVNDGAIVGPCPDAATQNSIDRAMEKASASAFAKKCPAGVVPTIAASAGCNGATDAADLSLCVRAAADASIEAMLATTYADDVPAGPIADAGLASCQRAIGAAAGKYQKNGLKAFRKCADTQDKGKTGVCLSSKFETQREKAAARVPGGIEKGCNDADVAALDALATFGGSCAGASGIAMLADCQVAEYDFESVFVTALVETGGSPGEAEFEVAPGTDRLRVTVNGVDAVANDIDVYVKHGAPPTTDDFDARSINQGVFDGIEVISPAPGPWFVTIDEYSGSNIPLQITITIFAP